MSDHQPNTDPRSPLDPPNNPGTPPVNVVHNNSGNARNTMIPQGAYYSTTNFRDISHSYQEQVQGQYASPPQYQYAPNFNYSTSGGQNYSSNPQSNPISRQYSSNNQQNGMRTNEATPSTSLGYSNPLPQLPWARDESVSSRNIEPAIELDRMDQVYLETTYIDMRAGDNREPPWGALIATHDTGTHDNWIDQGVVDHLGLKVESGRLQKNVAFNGKILTSNGVVNPTWCRPGSHTSHKCEFRVTKYAPFDVLFGKNFLTSKDGEILSSKGQRAEPVLVLVPKKMIANSILPTRCLSTSDDEPDEKQPIDKDRKKIEEKAAIHTAYDETWRGNTLRTVLRRKRERKGKGKARRDGKGKGDRDVSKRKSTLASPTQGPATAKPTISTSISTGSFSVSSDSEDNMTLGQISEEWNPLLTPEETRDKGETDQEFQSTIYQPTVSANSTSQLSEKQIRAIAKNFAETLVKNMPFIGLTSLDVISAQEVFREHFQEQLKNFSDNLTSNTRQQARRQAAEQIWILRQDVSKRYEELLGLGTSNLGHSTYSSTIEIAEKASPQEKAVDGKVRDRQKSFPRKLSSAAFASSSNAQDKRTRYVQPDEDANDVSMSELGEILDIIDYLTTHDAFRQLVSELTELVQHYYTNQMESIRHRVLLGIRKHPRLSRETSKHQVAFHVEWDLVSFLQEQYERGLAQKLGCILTIAGRARDAQLTTVSAYLKQTWFTHPWDLLDTISSSIAKTATGDVTKTVHQTHDNIIAMNLCHQEIIVSGTPDFIVTVAQQLAWIVAAFRVSGAGLAYSYVSFCDIEPPQDRVQPTFRITSEVLPLSEKEPKSCWNEIVGNSVIVANFPVSERLYNESGLEIPLEIMAGLGGTATAVEYDGGYILKGALMMFVPVKRISDSVQWHLVQKRGNRIRYKDVLELCPDRLLLEKLGEDDLLSTKAFLGWCPSSINNIATTPISSPEVGYSKTNRPSSQVVAITGATVGFSNIGSCTATFSFGKTTAPYTSDKPKYYTDALNNAKQIHVILQDTELRCAWQTDAERAILHIILHLQTLGKFVIDGEPVKLHAANGKEPSSVRHATLNNADIVIAHDQHLEKKEVKEKLFRDVFLELYTIFEGLEANTENVRTAGIKLKMDWRHHIQGYEYMHVVERNHRVPLKEAELHKTCGYWPTYARDIEAVVLFGTNFGELFMPTHTTGLCRSLRTMSKMNDYLAVEVSVLQNLYFENGSFEDQKQITATGMRWHRSQHIFEACSETKAYSKSEKCRCDRIQQFFPRDSIGSFRPPGKLEKSGTVIFGQRYSGIVGLTKSISSVLLGQNKAPAIKVPETLPIQSPETDNQIIHSGGTSSNSTPSSSILSIEISLGEEPGHTTYSDLETPDQLHLSPQIPCVRPQRYSSSSSRTRDDSTGVVTRESSNTNALDLEYISPAKPEKAKSDGKQKAIDITIRGKHIDGREQEKELMVVTPQSDPAQSSALGSFSKMAGPQRAVTSSSPLSLPKRGQFSSQTETDIRVDSLESSKCSPNQENYQERATDPTSKASLPQINSGTCSANVLGITNDMIPQQRSLRRKSNFQR